MEEIKNDTTAAEHRKEYVTPSLTDFGSFAEITQGNTGTTAVDNGLYS
jgi:hypothetical protein